MAYKKIFLTFDDGPGSKTKEIAKLLSQLGVKATFFMTGTNMERFPETVKEVARQGHEIGVHGYTHENLAKKGIMVAEKELIKNFEQIEALTGKKPTLFRAAYGNLSPEALRVAKRLGLKHVDWSYDTLDWKLAKQTKPINAREITKKAKNGDVVLFHDGAVKGERSIEGIRGRNLVAALPKIVEGLRERNFEFRPIKRSLQPTHRIKYAARLAGKHVRAHAKRFRKRPRV
jgi:peptidoglycan/xylan/chitin deacetylase (PgdA/CDA1 family)